MDYIKFQKEFKESGMTQKAYGEQLSMSSSMVHYYLQKGKSSLPIETKSSFTEVTMEELVDRGCITIRTTTGLEISIPIC